MEGTILEILECFLRLAIQDIPHGLCEAVFQKCPDRGDTRVAVMGQ